MEEKQSSIWVTLIRMRKHAWNISLGTAAALWGTTGNLINEVIAANNWCPGTIRFAGSWADGSKNVCLELKKTMDTEFEKIEKYLGGKERVEEKSK